MISGEKSTNGLLLSDVFCALCMCDLCRNNTSLSSRPIIKIQGEMIVLLLFKKWPALNDAFISTPPSLILERGGGSPQVTTQLPWEQETRGKIFPSTEQWHLAPSPSDSAELHIKCESRSEKLLFISFSYKSQAWPVCPVLFLNSPFLFLCFALKKKKKKNHTYPCGHLFTLISIVCITPPCSSLTHIFL